MPYDFSRVRAVLADDSPQMRRLLQALLREIGLSDLHFARDAHQAWELIHQVKPDMLITDWRMGDEEGEGDGLSLVKWLRRGKDSPNRYLPVIMLTGYTEQQRLTEARNAGVHDFVAKPVRPQTLYRHLYAIVNDDREFILTKNYFGPDRRRRKPGPYDGPERRRAEQGGEADSAAGAAADTDERSSGEPS